MHTHINVSGVGQLKRPGHIREGLCYLLARAAPTTGEAQGVTGERGVTSTKETKEMNCKKPHVKGG